MKTTTCICEECNKTFEKPTNEYNRSIKFNRSFYCSRSCSGKANIKKPNAFGGKRNTILPTKRYQANPFKYYLRNTKKRNHKNNLDLKYLKELWNKQEGKCVYTGLKLKLNTHTYRDPDIRYTASLDRIDSNKGYLKGNVQFISTAINYMKHEMSHKHTVEFLRQIS